MALQTVVARFKAPLTNVTNFANKINSHIKVPDRFKGTFVDRWADYWVTVYKDYKDVARDAVKEVKDKPWKGVLWGSIFGTSYYCARNNPDEVNFRDTLLTYSNSFIFVGPQIRNPVTTNHLKSLEQYYNEGVVRRFSFGVFSIIWIDNYRGDAGAYKTTCDYLSPEWLTFHHRIVDIGFLNKWWILDKKMIDCDVNPNEWIVPTETVNDNKN